MHPTARNTEHRLVRDTHPQSLCRGRPAWEARVAAYRLRHQRAAEGMTYAMRLAIWRRALPRSLSPPLNSWLRSVLCAQPVLCGVALECTGWV